MKIEKTASIPVLFLFTIITILNSCASGKKLTVDFDQATVPAAPDYSNTIYWAALPDKKDSADHLPSETKILLTDAQRNAPVDVFYIHPTTYFGKGNWNADMSDTKTIENTNTSLINQASVFNGCGRIYAPEYRQATYRAYYHDEDSDYDKAFALAYTDVKNAFEYYLAHYNNGRPFIIAAHSQGTTHAIHLLQDYIDGKPLQRQLVAAYLIGMPVYDTMFTHINACDDSLEIGCYVTWRSYLKGSEKDEKDINAQHIVVTNPLTWSMEDTSYASEELNRGGIGRDPEKIYDKFCGAQIHHELLWISKPDVPFKFLLFMKNYHIADYNLFWMNIRMNAEERCTHYTEKK